MTANRMHPLAAVALVATLACLLASAAAVPAAAQCGYTALTDKSVVTVSNSPAFFTINQPSNFWTAVAVRSPSGTDWDISLWQDPYTYPGCVTNILAGSSYGGSVTDFVVADYNHNPFGTRYVEVNRYAGTGDATLEWNASNGVLPLNGPYVTLPGTGLYIYDVLLEAGVEYGFTLTHTGTADPHMYLFRNAAGGACWKGRIDAEFDVTSGTTYTAPATDWYGLVVVNDNGLPGDARIRMYACSAPYALTSGEVHSSVLAENYYSITQVEPYWTAVGLRGTQYWELDAYRSRPATPGGPCLADALAGTNGGSISVGVVVGDFNCNTPGTYYLKSRFPYDVSAGTGSVQWDSGHDRLWVNDMLTHGTMSGTDIVRAWDVLLDAGTTYHFTFSRSGADLKLLVFENSSYAEYWAGRGDQVRTLTGDGDYTPTSWGSHGIVLVNDDGGEGTYTLGIGTCATPLAMVPGDVFNTALAENYVQFTMDVPYWSGIGVRGSDPGTDWDMVVQGPNAAAFPACHGPDLAVSDQGSGTVDFVVGDFNHTSLGPHQAWPHTWFGEGSGTGTILWGGSHGSPVVNGPGTVHTTGPDDFLQVWDLPMTAGQTYTFTLFPLGTGVRLLLFRNPASGAYWAPRSAAEFEVTTTDTYVIQTYTAPTTDWYGIVVVNDAGVEGAYKLRVGTCFPPSALSSGVPATTSLLTNTYSMTQTFAYWTAIGVRSASPWVLTSGGTTTGGLYPGCVSWATYSMSYTLPPTGTRAPVVVGDFNYNAPGTYYADASQSSDPGGMATVEWDSGADQLTVGAPAVVRSTGPDDVLEAWDCWLQPQKYYTFNFTHTGTADVKLLVFRNTSGGAFWAPREEVEAETPHTVTWRTTGSAAQFYGLVVVNDNGGTGSYSLQVIDPGTVEVGEGPPAVTALTGTRPNPASGGVSIAFGLRDAADVSFQVHDPTGRLVAVVPARRYDAGRRTVAWDGRGDTGARLPAGLYFVRMSAGGRVVGTARVTLLE